MAIQKWIWLVMAASLTPAIAGETEEQSAPSAGLRFRTDGSGLFVFDTGLLRGRLKMDGRYQGLYPLVEKAGGTELTMPPGLLSPYRVFSRGGRYGDAARDWPTSATLRPDGAVEVHWPAQPEHPLEIKAVYCWIEPGILDFQIHVTPQKDMHDFELFLSSYYLTKGFRASVYVQMEKETDKSPGAESAGPSANSPEAAALTKQKPKGRFVPVDRPPDAKSGYVMYPRDEKALRMIQDGRWKIPPSPVDWDIGAPLAKPICLRRDTDLGITVVLKSPADDCFAAAIPWNQATPELGGIGRYIFRFLAGM